MVNPMKIFIGWVILAGLMLPAMAAEEFYVVQDVVSKKCFVIDKPIANSDVKLMGTDEKPFPTRAAAEAAMKDMKGCAIPG
jgi:hypothetical protein